MSERFDTFGPPRPEPDPWDTVTEPERTDDGGELDPGTAAALLEQTRTQAQRRFERRSPLLMTIAAASVLVMYGAVWMSVRNQHPYDGPSGTALAILYSTLLVWVVVLTTLVRRATGGVSGRSARQRRIAGVAFGVIWVSVYVFQGAIHHAGASNGLAYGIYPAVAPLVIVGAAAAAYAAAHQNWRNTVTALLAVALGAGAAYAGPATVWGVIGVGLCALLLGYATTQLWLRRG
jgi:hypothetical protein